MWTFITGNVLKAVDLEESLGRQILLHECLHTELVCFVCPDASPRPLSLPECCRESSNWQGFKGRGGELGPMGVVSGAGVQLSE